MRLILIVASVVILAPAAASAQAEGSFFGPWQTNSEATEAYADAHGGVTNQVRDAVERSPRFVFGSDGNGAVVFRPEDEYPEFEPFFWRIAEDDGGVWTLQTQDGGWLNFVTLELEGDDRLTITLENGTTFITERPEIPRDASFVASAQLLTGRWVADSSELAQQIREHLPPDQVELLAADPSRASSTMTYRDDGSAEFTVTRFGDLQVYEGTWTALPFDAWRILVNANTDYAIVHFLDEDTVRIDLGGALTYRRYEGEQ